MVRMYRKKIALTVLSEEPQALDAALRQRRGRVHRQMIARART
jgi:hypothetical protein